MSRGYVGLVAGGESEPLTKLLTDDAALEPAAILPLVYEQLRRLAQQQMNRERAGHTLQATALVHEAYVIPDRHWSFAVRGNDISGYDNPKYLDTLAVAYRQSGETAKTIELQKKALSLLAVDSPDRATYEERLREFQSASESVGDDLK